MNASVFIIIVTYNGRKWIRKCIQSIIALKEPVNVIVVDNNSTDDTLDILDSYQNDSFTILRMTDNLGFGKANNLGIKYALEYDAKYIYLLNQDAYLNSNTISGLIQVMEKSPDYEIISPMQYNGDGTELDFNFKRLIAGKNVLAESTKLIQVKFVMAAHWLIKSTCFSKVGGFDPLFQHYGEDDDFLNRARYCGIKIGISKEFSAYHDRSEREISLQKEIDLFYRNLTAVAADINYSVFQAQLTVFSLILKNVLKMSFSRKLQFLKYHINGYKNFRNKYEQILKTREKYLKKYNHSSSKHDQLPFYDKL